MEVTCGDAVLAEGIERTQDELGPGVLQCSCALVLLWSRAHARRYNVPMNTRTFGRLGWPASEVGYGLWGMGGWTGSDDAESLASLHPHHTTGFGCKCDRRECRWHPFL